MPSAGGRDRPVFRNVLDYHFVINDNQPVSFAELPVQWNKEETHAGEEKLIFLNGTINDGLKNICKPVKAWKFELSCEKEPKISVLSKGDQWYVLIKARKSYTEYIRTILITVHFLHFVKWNSQKTLKALWHNLSDVLSVFSCKPSARDLSDDHMRLIIEAVKRDEAFTKSKNLVTFLEESIRKNPDLTKANNSDKSVEDDDSREDDESREDDVCAICDNGGNLLICEGRCMRSFHSTVEEGADSSCASLGYTEAEYNAIKKIDFYCKNCQYEQHQCFACGELGSSDESSGAEVFRCNNESCGCFYHPRCVAKLLHPSHEATAESRRVKIDGGEQFECPRHTCSKCKGFELNLIDGLQFAICRRCPRAYHTKCLPRKIAFEEDVDLDKGITQRAWKGLIPNKRVLIYCLKHEIDIETSTPSGVHIKFPESKQVRSSGGQNVGDKKERTQNVNSVIKKKDKSLSPDTDIKKRVLKVMKNAPPSATNNVVSARAQSSNFLADFTEGKVEGSVQAIRAALKKLEEGGSIDDTKTFCESDILTQIIKWKDMLRMYLAPFLGGMHYTSFTRHFTRMDKLNEMGDKLHWYVEHGDVIVDFCCGANDFCRLLEKKLNKVGKRCTYRNYDILKSKNDLNFDGKEFVEERQNELIGGSRLIIVLDASSEVDADLDDEPIKKSMKLKPKLLILVAPREMKRLDEKDFPYELIWEDDQMFADDMDNCDGDVPVIYLWSCPDWTAKYKAIAEEHHHLSWARKNSKTKERKKENNVSDDFQDINGFVNFTEDDHLDDRHKTPIQTTTTAKEKTRTNSDGTKEDMTIQSRTCSSKSRRTKRKHPSNIAIQSETPDSQRRKKTSATDVNVFCEPSASKPHVFSLGFTLTPCRPFSQDNSAGWLEE